MLAATGRNQNITGYADNRSTPYIQSFNFSLQRELARNITFEVGWVGNKATKLWGNYQINDTNIYENGILDAFNVTRAGGNAPLFDRMLMGLDVDGTGPIPVVNGTTTTGSSAMRRWISTNQFIANGNVAGLANFLNSNTAVTGLAGGLLANGRLPANFIVANPQFASVSLNDGINNSTYHSLQTSITQRYTKGFSGQFSYVFSKNLGFTGIRDPRNYQLSKGILGNNRTHIVKVNGSWDLPFGSQGYILRNAQGWVQHIVGGWLLAPNVQWISGTPLSFTSGNDTVGFRSGNNADLVGQVDTGRVVQGNGFVQYFPGLSIANAPRPGFGSDTTTLNNRFTNRVIVDANGNTVLQNPEPGRTGNLASNLGNITGPAALSFDMSLSKKVTIREGWIFTLRGDAIDILNRPIWGNPNTDINSASFGRITNASGNRTVTLSARFDF